MKRSRDAPPLFDASKKFRPSDGESANAEQRTPPSSTTPDRWGPCADAAAVAAPVQRSGVQQPIGFECNIGVFVESNREPGNKGMAVSPYNDLWTPD